ncbi:MAG: virulence factor [Woeseiaceae bacterium]|nr:virulence factor [Woeseiaceae bacterium]
MIRKIFVYWRDIPAQVIVQRGRAREKAMLSPRFQEAIDRAAMRAGKGSSDAYIAEWRREATTADTDADIKSVAAAEAQRLETAFSDEALERLVKNHGVARE